jgi:hypothetical protein
MGGSSSAPPWLNPGSSGFASSWGVDSSQAPQSTGQTGPFSSLGSDPADSMQMGGNMLSSTPPTGAGTMQSLAGTMDPSSPMGAQATGIGGTAAGMPGATGSGGPGPMGGAPMAPSGTTSGIGGTAQGQGSPFASSGMGLFGGGNQQSQMMQEIMQMLRGGGNAWGT